MRTSDAIAVAYFLYLFGVAAARRRGVVALRAVIVVLVVTAFASAARSEPWNSIHDWIPAVYLLASYWLPAGLVGDANVSFERWLQSFDRRLFAGRAGGLIASLPAALTAALEAAYLFCYPLVLLGFAVLWSRIGEGEADRYWTAVLLAGFACYGMLPWLPTRPPRAFVEAHGIRGAAHEPGIMRAANHWLLARASVHWNTFPSGHVATAIAIALSVIAALPAEGAVILAIAMGIAAGSIVGRYHYAADAIAGAAVGVIAFAISEYVVPR